MKVIEHPNSAKVNFIDGNERYVGYDTGSDCCEHADWRLVRSLEGFDPDLDSIDRRYAADYQFVDEEPTRLKGEPYHEGGALAFRLLHPRWEGAPQEMWLVIFNCHNGSYSHGFTYDLGKGEQAGRL